MKDVPGRRNGWKLIFILDFLGFMISLIRHGFLTMNLVAHRVGKLALLFNFFVSAVKIYKILKNQGANKDTSEFAAFWDFKIFGPPGSFACLQQSAIRQTAADR